MTLLYIETNQYFHPTPTRESYSRQRFTGLAEKIKDDENIEESCIRALKQELGITDECSTGSIFRRTEERMSDSYPGLLTKYREIIVLVEAPERICGKSC